MDAENRGRFLENILQEEGGSEVMTDTINSPPPKPSENS
jgi:hypothetical protein